MVGGKSSKSGFVLDWILFSAFWILKALRGRNMSCDDHAVHPVATHATKNYFANWWGEGGFGWNQTNLAQNQTIVIISNHHHHYNYARCTACVETWALYC